MTAQLEATETADRPKEHAVHWLHVGTIDDIPQRGSRCVRQGDHAIALFRTGDDQLFAIEDKCPHLGGPLSQGIVHDHCVTCPLHNWVISLESGEAQGADSGSIERYPVRREGKDILIGTPHGD